VRSAPDEDHVPFSVAGIPVDAKSAIGVICGAFLLPHTIAKLGNIERASQLFDKVGFRPAAFFVVLTALLELIAAFGLISGLYPRVGAMMAATILIVAAYAVARVHGLKWRWQHPGIEYMLFWAAVCLCAAFLP
jgi:putative oxidoreductase